jgi:lipoyl(octanoyl) transferase
LLDLDRRGRDIRRFVHALEGWLIGALAQLGVSAFRAEGRIGIWVKHRNGEAKIGAIGIRVRRWVTLHGFSINVDPELSHFSGIVPCGLAAYPVTSLVELGVTEGRERLDLALQQGLDQFLVSLREGNVKA